jgi:hypothetical protein
MDGSAVARCMARRSRDVWLCVVRWMGRLGDGTARRSTMDWTGSTMDGSASRDVWLGVARWKNFMNRYVNGDGRKRIFQKPKSLGKYGTYGSNKAD